MSDADLGALSPSEICTRAKVAMSDAVAGEWVAEIVLLYIDSGRPDASDLADEAIRLMSFDEVAWVLAGFASVPWRQHVSDLLGWVDPPAADPFIGDLMVALLYQMALLLAGAVLAFDGRSPTGSPLPADPATSAVSQQKGKMQ